jgi:predicted phosphodiesterase
VVRVAALYDIHGNLPALEAVVEEIHQAQVDQVVVGGDVIPGPMPLETLEYLHNLDIPSRFIHGNCEVAVLDHLAGTESSALPEQAREAIHWTAQQLPADYQRLIASWPRTLRFEIPGLGPVMFCHATPQSEIECFTRLTSEDRLLPVFGELGVSLVVCGHTHMQFDRMIGNVRVVNAGSVGMPFGEAGASWLLLGPDVQLRHTHYDLEEAASRIRDTNYPQSQDFALNNVLNPPSEEAMLQVFSRSEL